VVARDGDKAWRLGASSHVRFGVRIDKTQSEYNETDVASGRLFCGAFQVSANVRGCWGQRKRSRHYRSSYPEAKRVEPDIGIAPDADGCTDKFALVAPGAAAYDQEARITALEPR
jgi:hypothetical protein